MHYPSLIFTCFLSWKNADNGKYSYLQIILEKLEMSVLWRLLIISIVNTQS